ncbi:hypothetical protein PSHT_08024 [Puccinia striiformis]|uniref:GPR1/FUN34/yaaH family protein n=1 Tax=Puccinia striiformis TaxID=27350 RepID=A0A2S4VT32_9BASI|nr:hypothetical protein PSHT_08024 [Puccinia striiformis]
MKQDSCDAVNSPNPRSLANGPGSYVTTTAPRKFANPAPLGLCSFAATTFLLSLMNLQTRGIKTESVIISMAYGYGGMIQVLAGMWEFACGNTFGATAFSSYGTSYNIPFSLKSDLRSRLGTYILSQSSRTGGFWISFGLILSPNSGILAAYANKKHELESALGLYLFSWFIFTTIMLLGSLRTSVALVALFSFLDVTFLLLAIGKLSTHAAPLTKAGGVFGRHLHHTTTPRTNSSTRILTRPSFQHRLVCRGCRPLRGRKQFHQTTNHPSWVSLQSLQTDDWVSYALTDSRKSELKTRSVDSDRNDHKD